MASLFGHGMVASTAGQFLSREYRTKQMLVLGIFCAILPDADVLAFKLGIPYEHPMGHRGFTHSLLFAAMIGLLSALFIKRKGLAIRISWPYFSICAASHGVLDAMTNGGLGIAFFWPFDNTRYFLPWHPIQVSPIGASAFLSEWGLRVITSELVWIGGPCLLFFVLNATIGRFRHD